ncbi:hypothetical protein KCU96_g62, partial [Aureobasidium melanogenum]
LTLVGRDSLGTSVGVVVSEVLMHSRTWSSRRWQHAGRRSDSRERSNRKRRRQHRHNSQSIQPNRSKKDQTYPFPNSLESTLLKPFSGNQAERTKPLSAMLGSVSMLKAGPSLSSAWRDGDEKSEPTGLIGDADELLARARRRAGVGPLLED